MQNEYRESTTTAEPFMNLHTENNQQLPEDRSLILKGGETGICVSLRSHAFGLRLTQISVTWVWPWPGVEAC